MSVKSIIQRFMLGTGPRPTGLGQWRISAWSFVGAFLSMTVLELLFSRTPAFEMDNVPMIIGSFGASAVLLYGAIESPLGQPRACFGGHVISAIIGLAVAGWSTVHGRCVGCHAIQRHRATALIAATQNEIGWLYIGIIALSASLMIVIALLVNNIERRWPVFWWSAKKVMVVNRDESAGQAAVPDSVSSHEAVTAQSSVSTAAASEHDTHKQHIFVSPSEIILPAHFSEDDRQFLKELQERLAEKTQ
ncbi:hypothetical protein NQZ79_g3065 [Umbelopsis isabellina]|nr:hypothetical protein NQZ79_g3065 [Umbelopsis isabellina]